jgi:hypothetical protein
MKHRIFRCRNAAPVCPVPVRTSTTRIGAGHRVGLKNSRDFADRILQRRNGDNRGTGAAQTGRFVIRERYFCAYPSDWQSPAVPAKQTRRRKAQMYRPPIKRSMSITGTLSLNEPSVISDLEKEFGIKVQYHVQETRKTSAGPRYTGGSLSL